MLNRGEDLTLRIFIDKNLVEVFANDRQAAVAAEKYDAEKVSIRLFSNGGDSVIKQLKCWKIRTIYHGGGNAAIPASE